MCTPCEVYSGRPKCAQYAHIVDIYTQYSRLSTEFVRVLFVCDRDCAQFVSSGPRKKRRKLRARACAIATYCDYEWCAVYSGYVCASYESEFLTVLARVFTIHVCATCIYWHRSGTLFCFACTRSMSEQRMWVWNKHIHTCAHMPIARTVRRKRFAFTTAAPSIAVSEGISI